MIFAFSSARICRCLLIIWLLLSGWDARAAACAQWAALPSSAEAQERDYLQAGCHIERHAYRAAIPLLEALLASDPWPVFQAELGRAYLGAQEFELARKAFRQALAADPPEAARRLLLVYLRLAEEEQLQAKDWFGSASIGLVYDSNINAGPRGREITLYGLPFTLSDDGLPKADQGLRVALSGVHARVLSDVLAWQSNLSLESMSYQRYAQYDTQQATLESGPRFNPGNGAWGLYVPLAVGQSWLGGNAYTRQYGLLPQLRYARGDDGLGTLGLFYQQTDYLRASVMSSQSASVYLAWRQTLAGHWSLEGSLRHVNEQAEDAAYTNQRNSVGLALRGSLLGQWRLNAELNLTQARYVAAEFWADSPRRDLRLVEQLSVSRDLAGGYYLSLAWQSWQTRSNLELYRSRRDQVQLQLSKVF